MPFTTSFPFERLNTASPMSKVIGDRARAAFLLQYLRPLHLLHNQPLVPSISITDLLAILSASHAGTWIYLPWNWQIPMPTETPPRRFRQKVAVAASTMSPPTHYPPPTTHCRPLIRQHQNPPCTVLACVGDWDWHRLEVHNPWPENRSRDGGAL